MTGRGGRPVPPRCRPWPWTWAWIRPFAGVLALLLAAACSREPAEAPAVAVAPAPAATAGSAPAVLLARVQADAITWLLVQADGTARPLGHSSRDTELLAVDDAAGRFVYRDGARLWQQSWRAPAPPQPLAERPPLTGALHAAWLDRDSGLLHVLEMREPTPAERRAMKPEPPDAEPVWAVLWRHTDGRWQAVERRATAWGGAGAAVFDDLRHERGRSARTVASAASCESTLCDDVAPADLVRRLGERAGQAEEWRRVAVPGGWLLFGVGLGETWHPTGPFLYVPADGAGPVPVAVTAADEALHLQPKGARLLVSPAAPPGPAHLVQLPHGPVIPLGEVATMPAWIDR
jgi:hypothetical protein